MRRQVLPSVLLMFVSLTCVRAENWPQWRGSELNGTSRERNLPVRWSATENAAWRLALPSWSGSTPIVWGERVFLSVADTGAGMTEEFIRTRLFHPFATTKAKGIGLGLYTCREVVEAHGGRIEVESKKGEGTRFRVVLPSDQTVTSRASGAQKRG